MQALGLIETRGLLPAIVCADVMLKTAEVELVGRVLVGGGLVTIAVTGDVGAVKAAVEAGVVAVEQISHLSLVSEHVIPRPHHDIESILVDPLPQRDTAAESTELVGTIKDSANLLPIRLEIFHKEGVDALVQKWGLEKSVNALQALSVVKLRNLAREYKELGVAGRGISKANKDLLIQKLKGYYEIGNKQ